jgi:hypothetical protein
MGDTLVATHKYLTTGEGLCGIMTVIVLALACAVMLTCTISYPEAIEALAIVG